MSAKEIKVGTCFMLNEKVKLKIKINNDYITNSLFPNKMMNFFHVECTWLLI